MTTHPTEIVKKEPKPRKTQATRPVTKKEPKPPRKTQATLLVELAQIICTEFWHTPDDQSYTTLPVQGGFQHWPIKSQKFRMLLAGHYYAANGTTPGAQAMQDALSTLEGHALYKGEEYPVHVRLAHYQGNIYLDLANKQWQAVEITPDGWRVIDQPPVRFRRQKGLKSLPIPEQGGHLSELRPFVNTAEERDWLLLLGFLVGALRPDGPYPVMVLGGEQGSAKTTLARLLKSLLDPNEAPVRSEPRNIQDLMIATTNSWLPVFDNLSFIPPWLSDALCRLSTGGGFATRKLYSDDEEALFNVARPLMITAIEDIVTRGDLLDRAIMLNLAAIPAQARRAESELWAAFEKVRPRILGALLDAAACALRNLPSTKLPVLPRMADFALWVTAAEPALGLYPGAFMQIYAGNRQDANVLALEADVVAAKLMLFMDHPAQGTEWVGTATELLTELNQFVGDTEQRSNSWPKRGDKLSGRLRRLAPNLRGMGLDVQFSKTTKQRTITIRKVQQDSDFSGNGGVDSSDEYYISAADAPSADASLGDRRVNDDATPVYEDATLRGEDATDAIGTSFSNVADYAPYGSCPFCGEPYPPSGVCTMMRHVDE